MDALSIFHKIDRSPLAHVLFLLTLGWVKVLGLIFLDEMFRSYVQIWPNMWYSTKLNVFFLI